MGIQFVSVSINFALLFVLRDVLPLIFAALTPIAAFAIRFWHKRSYAGAMVSAICAGVGYLIVMVALVVLGLIP